MRGLSSGADRTLMADLGVLFRERREELNLSQRQVAQHANVSQAAVSNYEAGTRAVALPVLLRLVDALAIPLCDVLDGPVARWKAARAAAFPARAPHSDTGASPATSPRSGSARLPSSR